MSRYLIINADDYGVCPETNEAVEEAFNNGCLTSCTVMPPAFASIDAIERAKRNQKIKMGLHITLNSEYKDDPWRSIAPPSFVSSLLESGLYIRRNTEDLYRHAVSEEVETEIFAQYRYIADRGYKPTHADNHCGTVYGFKGRPFYDPVFSLCSRYKLPFRLPKRKTYLETAYGGRIPEHTDRLHSEAVEKAARLGIPLPDDLVTNHEGLRDIPSYEYLKFFYIRTVVNLKEGITELYMHPSKESKTVKLPGGIKRVWEYRVLLDDDFKKTIEREGINLVSYDTAPFRCG